MDNVHGAAFSLFKEGALKRGENGMKVGERGEKGPIFAIFRHFGR